MRRSAGGEGVSPAASSLASTNESIGERGQSVWWTAGIDGLADRLIRPVRAGRLRSRGQEAASPAAVSAVRGPTAPSLTHCASVAIVASGSFPLGGIRKTSSSYRTALTSRLASRSPGTTAGPVSPPFRILAMSSSRRPPLGDLAWAE